MEPDARPTDDAATAPAAAPAAPANGVGEPPVPPAPPAPPAAQAAPPVPPGAPPVTVVVPPAPPAPSVAAFRLDDDRPSLPVVAERPTSWDHLTDQLVEQTRREGTWRVILRALFAVVGVVLALRLVFDEALPRIIAVVAGSLTVLLVAAMVVQAVSEARRARTLLIALAHLTRLARRDPALGAQLVGQVDAVVTALRATPRVWPWGGDEVQGLVALVAQHTAHRELPARPKPPAAE